MSTLNALSKLPINWPALIERYEQGHLTQKQFCQENNISWRQFKYYRQQLKRLASPGPKTTLLPITLKARPSSDQGVQDTPYFQLIFKNSVRCQVPTNFNAISLKQLIEVLQAC